MKRIRISLSNRSLTTFAFAAVLTFALGSQSIDALTELLYDTEPNDAPAPETTVYSAL
jgi:hypothetical protein